MKKEEIKEGYIVEDTYHGDTRLALVLWTGDASGGVLVTGVDDYKPYWTSYAYMTAVVGNVKNADDIFTYALTGDGLYTDDQIRRVLRGACEAGREGAYPSMLSIWDFTF